MRKINKKAEKLPKVDTKILKGNSENRRQHSKNHNAKSKNILPMKLKESPKSLKKNKTPKKLDIKSSTTVDLNLSEEDFGGKKNEKKIIAKELFKSSDSAKITDENLKKKKITTSKDEIKLINEEESKNQSSKVKDSSEKNERTIFIGNLPANIKRKQLENLLLPYGKLLKCRFRLPTMGKPVLKHKMAVKAGILNAYAELASIEEAQNALKLNGTEYKTHHLRVTKSTEKFNPNSISPDHVKRTIFVGNLKYSANDDALYNIFSSCGEIEYCRVLNNSKGCKGVAYVCFENSHSVGLGLELNGTLLEDRPLTVSKYSLNKIKENHKKGKKEEPKMNGLMRRVVKKFIKEKKVDPDTILDRSRLYKKNKALKESEKHGKIKKANKKKIEFRGVEVKSKKKFKSKPKGNKMLKDLAKKIAPK